MIPGIGATEILILLTIVLLLFGAKRIPALARSLGSGAREFREGLAGKNEDREVCIRKEEEELFAAAEARSEASGYNASDARAKTTKAYQRRSPGNVWRL